MFWPGSQLHVIQCMGEAWGCTDAGLPTSFLCSLLLWAGIKACVDVGKVEDAWQVLAQMVLAGEQADVRAYNILLKGHSRCRDTAGLDRVLQRMAADGVQPSAVTYNTLIDSYVRAGSVEEAVRCAQSAQAGGLVLDAWTYSTLIKGHVQQGDMATASAVLEAMQEAGVQPNCVTFTTLIDGHVRQGRIEDARRVLDAMVAAGQRPSVVTYNSLLRGYTMQQGPPHSLDGALSLLSEMRQQGVAPVTETFNTLMSAALAAGDARLCMALHRQSVDMGLRPDAFTYTLAIQAHARLSQPMEALDAFQRLAGDRSAQVDLPAYSSLVDAMSRSGDMESAERILKLACDFAEQQGGAGGASWASPPCAEQCLLGRALSPSAAGPVQAAEEEALPGPHCAGRPPPLEAFGAVVTGYARQMAVHRALATVRRFLALGGSPDLQMLDILFDVALRSGEYKVAMQAVRAMELVGQQVDKAKYRALLEQHLPQQPAGRQGGQGHNRTWADYQRRRRSRTRNVQLQRLLFWLGFPNRYYDSCDDISEDESEF